MAKKSKIQAVNLETSENNVLQKVVVDLDKRTAPPVVHLTKNDNSAPVIAITAQAQGKAYAIPDGAAVNLRLSAADGVGVRIPVADISADRQTASVSITGDMTKAAGTAQAVLEIVQGDGVIASAPIVLEIAESPVVEAVEVITTPAETVSLGSNNIVQYVYAYMDERPHAPTVYLTQYDKSIPVIAVNIVYDGQPYKIPDGAAVNVRMEKPDGKYVYNPALGLSDDRYTAYIAITAQMTAAHGMGMAVVELYVDGGIVGTAPIDIRIDANPVPEDAYISSDEYKTIYELLDDVEKAAKEAVEAANSVKDSVQTATDQATAAQKSAESAKESAEKAENVSTHPPILREGSDHWYIWDAETNDYVDSGVDAGVSVTVDPNTITGEPGTSAKVENTGTATDPVLKFTIPRGKDGEVSSVNGQTGDVVVQDKLTGKQGQTVGFDADGTAVAGWFGGQNLLQNSDFSQNITFLEGGTFVAHRGVASIETIDGLRVIKFTSNDENNLHYIDYRINIGAALQLNTTYTCSVYVKTDAPINVDIRINECTIAGAQHSYDYDFASARSNINGWAKMTCRGVRTRADLPQIRLMVCFSENDCANKTMYIYHPKLEVGSIATDWSPAPEDLMYKTGAKTLTESWESLHDRIVAGDFSGIDIGDYKEIVLTTGERVVMEVAGIDQYYNCGDRPIGHHVDFVSRNTLKDVMPWSTTANNNSKDEATKNPWLTSSLYAALNETVYDTLPADLKPCIIEKRALLEERYSANDSAIAADTSWSWKDAGKLWLPTEVEIFGCVHWSNAGFGSGGGGCNKQYPLFRESAQHLIKMAGETRAKSPWWSLSVRGGSSSDVCTIFDNGTAGTNSAANSSLRPLLCFRIG